MENHETVTSNTDVLVKNHKLDDTDWDYRYEELVSKRR